MPKIVKLSDLNKKERKKIQEQTKNEVEERKSNIQNQISFKNNNRLPVNNSQNNFQLPVNNRVQNYNTTNNFSNAFEQFNFKNRSNSTNPKYYGKGNIDLNNRKILRNKDGSISTEQSMSFGDENGNEILVPTIINGKKVSEKEAIDHYYKTGEHLGKFETIKEAEEYAQALHNRQDKFYNSNVGDIQKETSQKVFEALNPGKKINYDNDSKSEIHIGGVLPYIAKNYKQGLFEGTAGIAQGQILNASNEAKKISEKDNKNKLKDLNDTLLQTLNPIYGVARKSYEIGQNTLNTLKDKDKTVKQKVAEILTNSVSGVKDLNNPIGDVVKLSGKTAGIINNKAGDKLLELNEKIEKPLRENREKLQEEGQNYSNIARMAGTVSNVVGNMTPSIIASRFGGGSEGLSQALSLGTMGLSAKGRATQEALNKGAELDKAIKIGDTKAMTEVGTELLTGGLNIFGKGALDNIVERGINKKVTNNVLNYLAKQGAGIVGEIGEETISDILNTVIDQGTVDPKATYSLKDWSDTALTTMLSTVVLNALGGAYSPRAYNQNVQEMEQTNAKQDITERINNSNLSEEDKSNMINYVQNEDFTQADYNAMRETIDNNQTQDVANNQETLYNNNESEGDIYDATRSNNQYNETEEIRENQPVLSENASTHTGNEITNELYEQNRKEVENTIKEEIKNNFGFNDEVSNDIYSKISQKENLTREDIYEAFDNHRDIIEEDVSDDVKQTVNDIKKTLRTIKINTSNLKGDIADYKDFYRRNFNRVSMGNGGIDVDVLYKELLDVYPGYFDENIINPADQLQQIVAWRDFDAEELLKPATYTLTDNDLENIADTILNYKNYLSSIKPKNSNQSSFIMPTAENNKTDNQKMPMNEKQEQEKVANILEKPQHQVKESDRKWAILKAGLLDKGIVFEELSHKTKNRELQGKWDYTLSATARGQNAIGNARYELDPKTKKQKQISKSLEDIRAEVGDRVSEFNQYMYHLLNIDRMTLEERFGGDTGTNFENNGSITNKPVFSKDITADISREIAKNLENKYSDFKNIAQDVYDYNNANKQELVKNGVISQELSDKLAEMYPHYVPIKRIDVKGSAIKVPLDTNRTGINSPLARATGGNSDIQPLFETMADRTMQTYRAGARNNFGVELLNTLNSQIKSNNVDVDTIIDEIGSEDTELLKEGKNGENPTFTVFNNGEKTTFEITKDMYDALKPLSDSSILSKTSKTLNKIGNIRRGVLTEYNPIFSITNALKDAQDVIINSQHTAKTFSKFPEAYTQILKKGYWFKEYVQNGGEQNSYFKDGEFTSDKKVPTAKKALRVPLEAISNVNNVIEMAPRLAEYIASRESGKSVETSMLDASRVTTNFKAGGDITKFANRNGATFLNASVQGFQQQIRNIKEANVKGLKGYAVLAGKYTIAGVIPAIINSLIWRDDKDYEDLQDYVKDNYYCVAKLGDGKFIRIPKGRMVATLQKIVSNIGEYMTDDKKINIDNFAKDFWEDLKFGMDNVAPNNPLDNNVISPIIQAITNKSWYGEDIVPSRLQKKPPAQQYDETTDSISKWLGNKLNISPYKINYLLDQYSGGVGDIVLPMMTKQAENNVVEDKFTTDSVMKSKYPGQFFELKDKLQTNNASDYATDEDKLKYKYINDVSSELSDLYNKKREIQNSDISDKDKKKQLKEVQKDINILAKDGIDNIDKIKVNKNTATVDDKQYYKYKGEWTELSDKDKEKTKNISLSSFTDYKNKIYEITKNKKESEENIKSEDKIQLLLDSKYSEKDKEEIYKNYIGLNDSLFNTIKSSGMNMDNYLEYKKQNFESDKEDDGTVKGKSQKNKKDKVVKYLNSMNITGQQRLLLYASQGYSTSNSQKKELVNYISNLDLNLQDKLDLFNKFSGFEVYKNGQIKY